MSAEIAIHHVAFRCRDIAAQEAFYTKHFGFKRCRTFQRGQPGEFFLLKLGPVRLELFPSETLPAASEKGGEQSVGFRHLAFSVPSIDAFLAKLQPEGIAPDKIIDLGDTLPGLRVAFFRDPEGNIIELMENYRDEE